MVMFARLFTHDVQKRGKEKKTKQTEFIFSPKKLLGQLQYYVLLASVLGVCGVEENVTFFFAFFLASDVMLYSPLPILVYR